MFTLNKKFNLIWLLLAMPLWLVSDFPPAAQTLDSMNQEKEFALGWGTAFSQANPASNNTMHPEFMLYILQKQAFSQKDPRAWLGSADRIWYILNALPTISCASCNLHFEPQECDLVKDKKIISAIIDDIASHPHASALTISKCPKCHSKKDTITLTPIETAKFGPIQEEQMIQQIDIGGFRQQKGCVSGKLPIYRLSIELADLLQDNNPRALDCAKLQAQAQWLQQLGNTFIFLFHYTLPINYLDLFETQDGIEFFANYAQEFVKANPQTTHICPISQPIAYSFRVKRQQNLPPFDSKLSQPELFKNLIKAHVLTYKKIKAVNPNVKVFFCHQYKPMVPYHSKTDPRYLLEKLVCSIADKMYNQQLINELKKYPDCFDGLALSVYPPVYFNGWTPMGDNCNGAIDEKNSLESIMAMHRAFPDKEIIVTETGCNNQDSYHQNRYVDMMLSVCHQARQLGADVNGCFLWAPTRDKKYYREWNTKAGSSCFGMFDSMDPNSINASGRYIQEIMNKNRG